MSGPDTARERGVKVTRLRIVIFLVGLMTIGAFLQDALAGDAPNWWTLYRIALGSAVAIGGVLWFISRAKRRAGTPPRAPPN